MCLEHLSAQTIVDQLQVIVVSDGQDPAVAALANEHWPFELICDSVPKSQQGIARNKGVVLASHEYCLFTQDDCLLEPTACEWHLSTLREHNLEQPTAVLGFTTWDPAVAITPTMQWLEASGWQFAYPRLQPYAQSYVPKDLQAHVSYTIQISVPTAIARKHLFLTDVQSYGWEDIEWGTRLAQDNVRLFYEPQAIGYHHHVLTDTESLERMYKIGAALPHMLQMNPLLDTRPMWLRLLYNKIYGMFPTRAGRHRKAYAQGLQEGLRLLAQKV